MAAGAGGGRTERCNGEVEKTGWQRQARSEELEIGMCGRFTRYYTWAELVRLYRLTMPASNLQPRYNICPTTTVDVVIFGDGQRSLVPMRWGLIPGWWSKTTKEMKLATFNARAETIVTKPMFRDSVPAAPLSHACVRILRMGRHAGGQTAALLHKARRADNDRCSGPGWMGRPERPARPYDPALWSSPNRTSLSRRCMIGCRLSSKRRTSNNGNVAM